MCLSHIPYISNDIVSYLKLWIWCKILFIPHNIYNYNWKCMNVIIKRDHFWYGNEVDCFYKRYE